MTESYDAVVIGGGPAGAAAALLLARANWRVLLIERKAFPRRKVCGEYLSASNLPLLDLLGVGAAFRDAAGPEVRRVGVFTGRTMLQAALPRGGSREWGRALSRERLDTLMLAEAARAGVDARQPWAPTDLREEGGCYRGWVAERGGPGRLEFAAPIVVAAHGSWENGRLLTHPPPTPARPSDLLGFKAHFRNADLPEGLMPLLAFRGGYGGMVRADAGRVGLSLCIRRDRLAAIRRGAGGTAGEDVEAYLTDVIRGVRRALAGAERDGPWLAAGPIRPGVRLRRPPGVFAVGNAAGEAHPVVAEGLSMALQSAWLLTERLRAWRGGSTAALPAVAADYARAWRRAFGARLAASIAAARLAMNRVETGCLLPLLRTFPPLLTWAARWTGKVQRVIRV